MGQSLPWFIAAVLVLVGGGFIAVWLGNTAETADRDTLSRGADAVQSNLEEQIRILKLAGTGTQSLAGKALDAVDLTGMVGEIDLSILTSLLDVVHYPVDESGAGPGEEILDLDVGVLGNDIAIPDIDLSLQEFRELQAQGNAFFSAPYSTADGERLNYIVAMPVNGGDGPELVGVMFRPDRIVQAAVEAAGEGQYAVELVDTRYDDQLVVSIGSPSSDMVEYRSPEGVKTALLIVVRPGPGFPFVGSSWVPALVIGTALAIALLLVWMGRMARARSDELAERLRLAHELNENKDRFLATVSHELRTPLTVVLGFAEEIGPNWYAFEDDERREMLALVTEQATEAANIVEDLLVASRSNPDRLRLAMEYTTLRPHVEYALASLPDGARVNVTACGEDHPVYADRTRLRQILRNLLENAVRHGGEGIHVECRAEGNRVTLTVADNGDELHASDADRIFEPYEQAKQGEGAPAGVGIGLYVSRLLARLMGGDLQCSRKNGLTCFDLELLASAPAPAPIPADEAHHTVTV